MSVHDYETSMGLLRGVTIALEQDLPATDVNNVWELIDADEWGLAFDTLCTQLYEYDVRIDSNVYRDLVELGTQYNMSPELWEVLRPPPEGSAP